MSGGSDALLAQCRAGFEAEALEDLRRLANLPLDTQSVHGGTGYVVARTSHPLVPDVGAASGLDLISPFDDRAAFGF